MTTQTDEELKHVSHYNDNGWPRDIQHCNQHTRAYYHIRHELVKVGDLILRGNALVMSQAMRNYVLNCIHDGHFRQNKNLAHARGHVYWPGKTNQFNNKVASSSPCQMYQRRNPLLLLLEHEKPNAPWQKIGSHVFTNAGDKYLITVDCFSGFPVVLELKSTTSSSIIAALKTLFARYRFPQVMISDNAPNFISHDNLQLSKTWRVTLKTSSPYHAASNGVNERNVQTLKQAIRKCGNQIRTDYHQLNCSWGEDQIQHPLPR